MGKKIVRVVGAAVCVLLFALCIFMLVVSAVFGSAQIVDAFGFNLYLCGESAYAGLENGSAVIVEKCEPYELEKGNLILYTLDNAEEEKTPALAYFEQADMTDGVYYIDVTDSEEQSSVISGSSLIGRASWSSPALGKIIEFSLSKWGICLMAVLPCVALIVYSMVKTAVDNAPPPEVIPQRKHIDDDDDEHSESALALGDDGNARYSRHSGAKNNNAADGVLFTYARPKSPATMKPAPSAAEPERPSAPVSRKPSASGSIPTSVAARKYIDSATAAQKKTAVRENAAISEERKAAPVTHLSRENPITVPAAEKNNDEKLAAILSGATSELPIAKKKKSDAFFAQSDAPQIGRGIGNSSRNRAVIDLEDALATASAKDPKKPVTETAGRRSASILAAKSRSELISDDDDSRDRNRYDVDDILSGIDSRRRK